ncbi:hypothetical protein EXS71_00190 [Candidatus Uhrbacteria bacterium]|nr:hypothetical protein [Candidatus Uhrbacteria bacterium]
MRVALIIWLFILSASPALAFVNTKIVPGLSIWHVRLDHLDQKQAVEILQKKIPDIIPAYLTFQINRESFDLKTDWIHADLETTINQALAFGHSEIWWRNWFDHMRLYIYPVNLEPKITIDEPALRLLLQPQLDPRLITVKNAELMVSLVVGTSTPSIRIETERDGVLIDTDAVIRLIRVRITDQDFSPITIPTIVVKAERRTENLEPLRDQVPSWLAYAPFELRADGERFKISPATLASWLDGVPQDQTIVLGLNPDRVEATLKERLDGILQTAKDGSLTLEEDTSSTSSAYKIKSFIPGMDGVDLDTSATVQAMQQAWTVGSSTIPITLTRHPAIIEGADAERLGIHESIGVGRSNFSGSPVNRRKNIALGAQKVSGVLIPPDTEFSLIKTLTPIDQTAGWLKELVIKDNKTIPEFGGGLCQIGTTVFRAAIDSGLPITSRVNHAYRVPYYEPAGKDATIYDPAPDMKFKNDTGHWILVSSHIKGDNISFTFWGTRDGREITQSDSRVYNFVPPPAKKIIETLDLPPGQIKCTEKAHTGADASFTYDVVYPDGKKKHVTFFSHYKPWGAVCLLGVAQLSASSTTPIVDETGVNNPN